MAKKANSTPAADTSEVTETEVTASALIDQPAVSGGESASSPSPAAEPVIDSAVEPPSSPAEPAIVEPVTPSPVEEPAAGGGFNSPFAEPPSALTMVQRIELLEARLAALEAK
jgi:hypothetical protein